MIKNGAFFQGDCRMGEAATTPAAERAPAAAQQRNPGPGGESGS